MCRNLNVLYVLVLRKNALSNDALKPNISYGFLELDGDPMEPLGTNVKNLSGSRGLMTLLHFRRDTVISLKHLETVPSSTQSSQGGATLYKFLISIRICLKP